MRPEALPPWQTVYGYFRQWRLDGTWERIHTALRERTRLKAERGANPAAAILDSQSVRTSEKSYGQWHEIFPDSVLAVALLDRLLHHSTTINIRGDSYRQRHRKQTGLPQPQNWEDTMT